MVKVHTRTGVGPLRKPPLLLVMVVVSISCFGVRGVQGHPVEQLFATLDQEGDAWSVEVLFDAAFALPEFREDDDAPPPERAWLLERSAGEHQRIRDGAEAYLRERLRFFLGGESLSWEASFPDYEQSPPSFPKLLNGGAYLRVRMRGRLRGRGGELALEMSGGPGPNFVVAIGAEGEPRYVTVSPEERAVLFEVVRRRVGTGPAVWAVAGGLIAGLAAVILAVVRRRSIRRLT